MSRTPVVHSLGHACFQRSRASLILSSLITLLVGCSGADLAPDQPDTAPVVTTDSGDAAPSDAAPPAPPKGVWARTIGAAGIDTVRDVAISIEGDVFVLGVVEEGTGLEGTMTASSVRGFFLTRFNSKGEAIWTAPVSGSSSCGGELTVSGDAVLVGCNAVVFAFSTSNGSPRWLYSASIFVTTPIETRVAGNMFGEVAVIVSGGLNDGYLAKLAPDGHAIFSQPVGHSDSLFVDMDETGSVYIGGSYADRSMKFDGTPMPNAGADIFEAKFDPAGRYLWSMRQGDSGAQGVLGFAVDGDHIIVVASNDRELTFETPRPNKTVVAGLDAATGSPSWSWGDDAFKFEGFASSHGHAAIAFNLATSDKLAGLKIGGDDQHDHGLVGFDASTGAQRWTRFVGLNSGVVNGLAIDAFGGPLIGGSFTYDFAFDQGTRHPAEFQSQDDGFVAKYGAPGLP